MPAISLIVARSQLVLDCTVESGTETMLPEVTQ